MTLTVPDFHDACVLVAGDVMLDRYWFGPAGRISPEAPVPVVNVNAVQERPGGAANVAVNLANLGVRTRLIGVCGDDEAADRLQALIAGLGIDVRLQRESRFNTVTKLRVLSRNQQLIRLDFDPDPAAERPAIAGESFDDMLDQADAVVLSDYGKGGLAAVETMIARCRDAGVPVFVDPKGADFHRYRGANVMTPNLAEFNAVAGPSRDEEDFARRGQALREDLDLGHLLVTRSDRGMILFGPKQAVVDLPAEAREVFDVTGAGDTVIAVAAAAVAAGMAMDQGAALANLAAGLVVRKLGVASVTPSELRLAQHQRGKGGRGILDEDALAVAMGQARDRGERVVMTNGCFDLLHAGHVAYLEEAKALGDRLVVAVNDDESVRRLKGRDRPLNALSDRLAVLSGLAAVDWVVPFSEDTPQRLISRLLPDLLVKGGDYRPEDIAGGDCVVRAGGQVRVLSYREGNSTSDLLARLRDRQDDGQSGGNGASQAEGDGP
jgi:D-beta-D-heptose 7-phosphate kinase/D-beta-D-heptose 1-phosphate adenosyltransferase